MRTSAKAVRIRPKPAGSSTIKRVLGLALRLTLTAGAMIVAYALSTMVMGGSTVSLTEEQANRAGAALVAVSLINALVLGSAILRSSWHGLRLIAAVSLLQFGVETFMGQLETLYYNDALLLAPADLVALVAAGALRALLFAPAAVLILGKMRRGGREERVGTRTIRSSWASRFAAVTVLYVIVYFLFGYLVAWQWEAVRLFYSDGSALKPFFAHFRDLFLREDPLVLPFQLLRGALWAGLASLIVRMIHGRRWEAALATAAIFAALLAVPVGLFPNPYMPDLVREAHFYEILSSMLLFGGLAGWLLHGPGRPDGTAAARRTSGT